MDEEKNTILDSVQEAKEELEEKVEGVKNKKVLFISLAALAIAIAIFGLFVLPQLTKKPGPQVVDTVSTLEKIVKSSSLSTYEVVYNGVAVVKNPEKPEKDDYYVSYLATVKAGFDFKEIEISKDDEKHIIVVSLPPIELEPKVKIEDLDYIIVNNKVKTETISVDAYKVCKQDVEEEIKDKEAIYTYAKKNGESLIKGLLQPFVDQLEDKYTIELEWRE